MMVVMKEIQKAFIALSLLAAVALAQPGGKSLLKPRACLVVCLSSGLGL